MSTQNGVDGVRAVSQRSGMSKAEAFRCFKTSPGIIRLVVMMYVRFPLSLRNVEDLLHERGVDISHETAANHFNTDRSLSSRPTFKLNRAAVLDEWRGFCSA